MQTTQAKICNISQSQLQQVVAQNVTASIRMHVYTYMYRRTAPAMCEV